MSSLTKRIVNPVTHGGSARWCEDGLSQIDLVRGLIIGFAAGTWMVFCGGCMLISGYSASYMTGRMPFLLEHRRKLSKNCRAWLHHTKMMYIVLQTLFHSENHSIK